MAASSGKIICAGNSITFGTSAAYGWPAKAETNLALGGNFTWTNVAIGGQSTPQMIAVATSQIDALYDGAKDINIVCIWEFTNDLVNGGSPWIHAFHRTRRLCGERVTKGFCVITATMLPEASASDLSLGEADRTPLNTKMRAEYRAFSHRLADVAANTTIGDAADVNDTTYYNADKVHPKTAGQDVIASVFGPQIQAAIAAWPSL